MHREPAFIALGSNLGDRDAHLESGRRALAALPDTVFVAASRVEETDAIGPPQPTYLNQMVLVRTALAPLDLLRHCLAIEAAEGRVRAERWGPRSLDLDIVRFGDRRVDEPGLTLPHPELRHRPFWQRELAELEAHVS